MKSELGSSPRQLEYLVGREKRKVDDKGRVVIPSNIWKGDEGDYAYLRVRKDNIDYFDIIPGPYFDQVFSVKYSRLKLDNIERENFFGSLSRVKLDNQNRITIPVGIRSFVKESRIVSFIGIGDAIRVRP
jgi:DNA-binding transcriptional regulator/RsmH inhibitor MraZ